MVKNGINYVKCYIIERLHVNIYSKDECRKEKRMELRYQSLGVEAGDNVKLVLQENWEDGKINMILQAQMDLSSDEAYLMGMSPTQKEKAVEYMKREKIKFFEKMSMPKRRKVVQWLQSQQAVNEEQETFLLRVKQAAENMRYGYWMTTKEASIYEDRIQYLEKPLQGEAMPIFYLKKLAEDFAPEKKSRIATLQEFDLWNAYQVVNHVYTLEKVIQMYQTDPQKLVCDKEGYIVLGKDGIRRLDDENVEVLANVIVAL